MFTYCHVLLGLYLYVLVSRNKFSTKAALRFLMNTCRTEGVTTLWRGNSATMIRIVPYASIQFTSHEQFKILLAKDDPRYGVFCREKSFLVASLTAFTGCHTSCCNAIILLLYACLTYSANNS